MTHTTGKTKGGAWYLGIGFLLPTLLTLIGFIWIKVWPFGDGTVLIIDSIHQYLPFYTDFHDKLLRGEDLFYSFSAGMGYDFWSTFAYYMSSPLNLLIALVPTANVGDFMDLMIMLKIGLTGGTMSWYLHQRNPKEKFTPIVFGAMFALGNFMIGYYFNLMWLESIAMLPLIMCGIERITRGESARMYGLALFFGLWCNYYIGFMLCVFAVLYLFVCYAQGSGLTVKQFFLRSLRFGWYSLLAGGGSAVVLLPAYLSLMGSEAMEKNSFPAAIKFYTNFLEIIFAHFAAVKPINISSTQVGLNAYCGVAVLILVLCYILDKEIHLRQRVAYLVLTALLMLSFSLNMLNYIWHGFHLQNGLPNRFAFIYVALLLVMCFDVFPHLGRMHPIKLLVAGALPLALSIWAIHGGYTGEEYGVWNYITSALLGVYVLLIIVIRIVRDRTRLVYLVMALCMLTEAGAHGIYGIICNENVTRSIYLEDQASFKTMTAKTGDIDFYRAEIDSQRMRNVTMFAGGHSVVMFNSTMDAAVTKFCDAIGMEARTNKNGYNGVTKLMNDVFGIRYVLSSNGKADTLYQFQRVDSDGNLTMYKNDNALSLGFMCNEEIRNWDTGYGTPIEVQNQFVTLSTGLENLYVLDRTVEAENGENYQVKIPEDKQVYLYVPYRIASLELHTPEYSKTYSTYTDHLYVINAVGGSNMADFTTRLNASQTVENLPIYTCANADYQKVRDTLAQSQLEDVSAKGRHLSGAIAAKKSGILLLTVPYDQDWHIEVDGKAIQAERIGGVWMGIALDEGQHSLSMTYTPTGFYPGLIISLVSAVLFVISTVLSSRVSKRRALRTGEEDEAEIISEDDEETTEQETDEEEYPEEKS